MRDNKQAIEITLSYETKLKARIKHLSELLRVFETLFHGSNPFHTVSVRLYVIRL